jgi:hypothetical protein
MFNNKHYSQVNREGRFYCALLAHALLSSKEMREEFSRMVRNRRRVNLSPSNFEIYIQAAVLRDYWRDLGDPNVYSDETHQKRLSVLHTILEDRGVPESAIEEHDLFWTTAERNKVWMPGRWPEQALREAGLEELIPVKWAFNASPDLLIVSGRYVMVVDASLDPADGVDSRQEGQQELQELIAHLIHLLVPQYRRADVVNFRLSREPSADMTWSEAADMIKSAKLDSFTKRCFSRLDLFDSMGLSVG